MLYFIPWVVFLLAVVLSVPVVSWLEKRKHGPPKSSSKVADDAADDESAGDDPLSEDAVEVAEDAAEVEMADDVQFDAPGGEDFSAFEEDFK
ncbi:hypothetical protein K227x_29140 [Rubripirellula lacrimiformis]|uniref:Uncharacterized protein n=1 Tax=Rubripirellula lacrimiformis TaxID=1930273 RepID=A0A517NBL2_9BACT|nr:hypothetical protein [Rubripirellula lacrimiformis]QDT04522.1 hypothetical protein K227x_29140 [Rubripirellula lacrimiformis]